MVEIWVGMCVRACVRAFYSRLIMVNLSLTFSLCLENEPNKG